MRDLEMGWRELADGTRAFEARPAGVGRWPAGAIGHLQRRDDAHARLSDQPVS